MVAAARRGRRGGEAERFDRQDMEFLSRVRQGYFERMVADPGRFQVIDAAAAPAAMIAEVVQRLDEFVRSTTRGVAHLKSAT